jgi:hypothetical protein
MKHDAYRVHFQKNIISRSPKITDSLKRFDPDLQYAAQSILELQIPPSQQPERQDLFAYGIYPS